MFITFLGLLGIYNLTSFAQSVRVGYSGSISTYLSILMIPAAISILWAVSLAIGWWSVAIFVIGSLIAGTVNGLLLRELGCEGLLNAQPLRAIAFTSVAIGIWVPSLL